MPTEIATDLEQRLVASINEERAAEGLPPLRIEAHLNASAQSHSDWMADTGTFSHAGEGGSSATDRIEEAGFPLTGSWQTAENIAYISITGDLDAGEADRMHDGLMESEGHRENILDPGAAYVGIGLSPGTITLDGIDHEVVFLTQNFADTDGEVLVQGEVDGQTVLQPYQDGEPVGDPQPADTPPDEDEEEHDEERHGFVSLSLGGTICGAGRVVVLGSRGHGFRAAPPKIMSVSSGYRDRCRREPETSASCCPGRTPEPPGR